MKVSLCLSFYPWMRDTFVGIYLKNLVSAFTNTLSYFFSLSLKMVTLVFMFCKWQYG